MVGDRADAMLEVMDEGMHEGKRSAGHVRLEVPGHQSLNILSGPSVGHAK